MLTASDPDEQAKTRLQDHINRLEALAKMAVEVAAKMRQPSLEADAYRKLQSNAE